MALANMKIGTRLTLGFGIVGMLLLIIIAISLTNLAALNNEIDETVNDKFPKVVKAANSIDIYSSIAIAARSALIMSDKPEKVQEQIGKIMAAREKNNKNLEYLEKTTHSEEGKAILKKVNDARSKFREAQDNYIKLLNAGSFDEAKPYLIKDFLEAQHAVHDAAAKLIEYQTRLMEETGKHAADRAKTAQTLVITLGLIAIAMAVVVSFLIIRGLLKQLGGEPDYAAEVARKVASGDLSSKIAVKEGDTSSLLAAMKSMQEMLARIVTDIKEAVDSVNTASKEIASGNADLSQRTEEQASSLEETASSMEELTSTVRQNAENSKQANQLAVSASDVAGRGGEVVGQVVDTMSSINESSRKIVDIISVIDGIAFQTNILALNAAVEAARAGEQGRGFAVVAAEVRNLAQRSAAAAKEIKSLIGDSVGKVENGAKLVEQAGQTMDEIVTSIKRVTDIMAEISAASVEQSTGIEQVNQAITQMDDVTQQNAALVEQAAASAEALEEQAQNLARAVSVFRLAGGETSSFERRAAVKPAAPRPAAAKPAAKAVKPVPASLAKSTAVAAKPANDGDDEWKEF